MEFSTIDTCTVVPHPFFCAATKIIHSSSFFGIIIMSTMRWADSDSDSDEEYVAPSSASPPPEPEPELDYPPPPQQQHHYSPRRDRSPPRDHYHHHGGGGRGDGGGRSYNDRSPQFGGRGGRGRGGGGGGGGGSGGGGRQGRNNSYQQPRDWKEMAKASSRFSDGKTSSCVSLFVF